MIAGYADDGMRSRSTAPGQRSCTSCCTGNAYDVHAVRPVADIVRSAPVHGICARTQNHSTPSASATSNAATNSTLPRANASATSAAASRAGSTPGRPMRQADQRAEPEQDREPRERVALDHEAGRIGMRRRAPRRRPPPCRRQGSTAGHAQHEARGTESRPRPGTSSSRAAGSTASRSRCPSAAAIRRRRAAPIAARAGRSPALTYDHVDGSLQVRAYSGSVVASAPMPNTDTSSATMRPG